MIQESIGDTVSSAFRLVFILMIALTDSYEALKTCSILYFLMVLRNVSCECSNILVNIMNYCMSKFTSYLAIKLSVLLKVL